MTNVKGRLQELCVVRGLPMPDYNVQTSGPSHFLTLRCTVTVQWGGQWISEVVEKRGGKKKDVEKLAAAEMLRRLLGDDAVSDSTLQEFDRRSSASRQSLLPSRCGPGSSPSFGTVFGSPSPVGVLPSRVTSPESSVVRNTSSNNRSITVSPGPRQSFSPGRCASSSTRSPSPRSRLRSPSPKSTSPGSPPSLGSPFVRNTSVSPSSATVSSLLGSKSSPQSPISTLQERLQSMKFPLPSYANEPTLAAGSLSQVFRTRCTVSNRLQKPVLETEGCGCSKQHAKEEAAQRMLKMVEEKLEDMTKGVLSPLKAGSECPEVFDPELDHDLASRLSPLLPQYHTWQEGLQVGTYAYTSKK